MKEFFKKRLYNHTEKLTKLQNIFFDRISVHGVKCQRRNLLIKVTTCILMAVLGGNSESLASDVEGAQTLGGLAISARAGTLGLGLEATTAITKKVNAKVVVNGFSFSDEGDVDDIDYDFDIDLFTAGALLDWHPFNGSSFRISGGLLYNGNELDADATTRDEFDIGDNTYTSAEIGTLNGSIDFNNFAPYFGIGWGNSVGKDTRWEVLFDIGFLYMGSANADLESSGGTLSNNATLQADLQEEEDALEDDIEDFAFYPVFSFGVSYKF